MGSERRIEPRLIIPMRIRYRVPNPKAGRMDIIDTTSQNIGLGGLMIVTHQPLEKGFVLKLEVFLQSSDREPIHAEGKVMWQISRSASGAKDRYDTGIKFRFTGMQDKRRFLDFIFKNQDQIIGLDKKKY